MQINWQKKISKKYKEKYVLNKFEMSFYIIYESFLVNFEFSVSDQNKTVVIFPKNMGSRKF